LQRAHAVACVSNATLKDARRLLNGYGGALHVVPNALNYPYRRLEAAESRARLASVPQLADHAPYVLQVGSGLRRKNRECTIRALASIAASWPGKVVFAGQPLDAALVGLAASLGVAHRLVEVRNASDEVLEALYNEALAMLFPSRFEGFGWPIIEAQACGCPVICSDREPFPEVSGGAAMLCDADDFAAFGQAILKLANADYRAELVRRGLENAAHFDRPAMITRFVALYEQVAGAT
jgi:glycosyltransferase involved in cell wall biosynthesis